MAKRKKWKRPQRPRPYQEHIEGDFDILGYDSSMRRPGFAHLHYDAATRSVTQIRTSYVSNKYAPAGMVGGKPHGQILDEIYDEAFKYLDDLDINVFVREAGFSRFAHETQTLNKVCGLVDFMLWHYRQQEFDEMAPTTIKKIVTGSGVASKPIVEDNLKRYVGEQKYDCDDESDAVAVAIAWLIEHGYLDEPTEDEVEATMEKVRAEARAKYREDRKRGVH